MATKIWQTFIVSTKDIIYEKFRFLTMEVCNLGMAWKKSLFQRIQRWRICTKRLFLNNLSARIFACKRIKVNSNRSKSEDSVKTRVLWKKLKFWSNVDYSYKWLLSQARPFMSNGVRFVLWYWFLSPWFPSFSMALDYHNFHLLFGLLTSAIISYSQHHGNDSKPVKSLVWTWAGIQRLAVTSE